MPPLFRACRRHRTTRAARIDAWPAAVAASGFGLAGRGHLAGIGFGELAGHKDFSGGLPTAARVPPRRLRDLRRADADTGSAEIELFSRPQQPGEFSREHLAGVFTEAGLMRLPFAGARQAIQ